MAEEKTDYSDYIQHISNILNSVYLLSGFTFTAITILLTWLPDPSIILAQVILFLLTITYKILIILTLKAHGIIFEHCREVPPPTKNIILINRVTYFIYLLFEVIIVLMILLRDLIYLSILLTIIVITSNIAQYQYIYRRHGRA